MHTQHETAAFRFFSTPTEFTVTPGWQGTVIIKKSRFGVGAKALKKFCLKDKGNLLLKMLFSWSMLYICNCLSHFPNQAWIFFLTRWSLLSPQGWRRRRQWDSPPSESLTWSLKLTPYRCSDPKRHLTALSFFWKMKSIAMYQRVALKVFNSFSTISVFSSI